jgi:riboflavin kinase/FMN adenylyltransferase
MEVSTDLASFRPPESGTAVTIGAYDGVHLGHKGVLREVRRRAALRGLPTVVVTFDRHPATVVRPESAPKLLTDLEQRLELLAATGDVDHVVVLRFDEARSKEEAGDFVVEVMADGLRARLVVVGEDFHFGRGRRGNVALLREMGGRLGFEVAGLQLFADDRLGTAVSSTAVRQLVAAGDVAAAGDLLGRPYELRGTVVTGDGRGKDLGFPTANVEVSAGILVPGEGIYAGWYERPGGDVHAAAASVGRRPTFVQAAATPVVEAYLLDFDGDLYGEAARLRFVSRLRGEERFESADALVAQMAHDVESARAALSATSEPDPGGQEAPVR